MPGIFDTPSSRRPQLETHSLWTYVDPTDGEYVRPSSGEDLDSGQKLEDLLLSAWFTLRNGTKFIGFVHGVAGEFEFSERCFGDLRPYLVLSDSVENGVAVEARPPGGF